jgi:DNA-3-methyladenine glycosylase
MQEPHRRYGPLAPFDRQRLAVPAAEAAVALLGAVLVREGPGGRTLRTPAGDQGFDGGPGHDGRVLARVVETEAYREDDPASHSHAKRTRRSEPMFWRPGTSYVYRSYGVHWCINVAAEAEGIGAAVLLRAAVVVAGAEVVAARRPANARRHELLRGPGRLTQGLDLDAPRHDRGDVIDGVAGLRLACDDWRVAPDDVVVGPRVGVRLAPDVAWRFHLRGTREVSPYRRSPRAAPAPHR